MHGRQYDVMHKVDGDLYVLADMNQKPPLACVRMWV